MTYKDQLENRKNARKHAQHQNQQEQPAKLASRKKDLLAHLVPIQSLKVSQERVSFFLPITKETMTKVPLMPDQDYKWLSDKKWRAHNDAIFRGKVNPPS